MPEKITARTIEAAFRRRNAALDRGETAYRERIRDVEPGLVFEVGARGASWRREYRPRGTTPEGRRLPGRTIVIGDGRMTPEAARAAAAEIGRQVAEGRDPADERRIEVAQRTAERLAGRKSWD